MILCYCQEIAETSSWEYGDTINLIGLIVNFILGIIIVVVIQKRETDRRVLNDHLIEEVKDLRNDYRIFFQRLEKGIKPQEIASWFKLTNIKSNDLLDLIAIKNPSIQTNYLKPFQKELKDIISDSKEYEENYFPNNKFKLKSATVVKVQRFRQQHDSLFNQLIVQINEGT